MEGFLFVLIGCNLAIFSSLALAALVRARRETSPAIRKLSWVLAATAAAFALSAAQRMAIYAVHAGWIEGPLPESVTRQWQLAQSVAACVLGIVATVVWHRLWRSLRNGHEVARILTENLPDKLAFDTVHLTRREREIIGAIGSGCITDHDLAARFFIAPATARTHVRNIMRKTNITSRRDLMVMAHHAGESSTRLARRRRLRRAA